MTPFSHWLNLLDSFSKRRSQSYDKIWHLHHLQWLLTLVLPCAPQASKVFIVSSSFAKKTYPQQSLVLWIPFPHRSWKSPLIFFLILQPSWTLLWCKKFSHQTSRTPSYVHPYRRQPSTKKTLSYHPISNLSFICKMLERIVATQLNGYLTMNHLYAKMQSA